MKNFAKISVVVAILIPVLQCTGDRSVADRSVAKLSLAESRLAGAVLSASVGATPVEAKRLEGVVRGLMSVADRRAETVAQISEYLRTHELLTDDMKCVLDCALNGAPCPLGPVIVQAALGHITRAARDLAIIEDNVDLARNFAESMQVKLTCRGGALVARSGGTDIAGVVGLALNQVFNELVAAEPVTRTFTVNQPSGAAQYLQTKKQDGTVTFRVASDTGQVTIGNPSDNTFYTLPIARGAAKQVLTQGINGALEFSDTPGSGDVFGPSGGTTTGMLATYSGTSGKIITTSRGSLVTTGNDTAATILAGASGGSATLTLGGSGAGSGTLVVKNNVGSTTFSTGANGNTLAAGTLGSTGDFTVNSNKFTVTAASGSTTIGDVGTNSDVTMVINANAGNASTLTVGGTGTSTVNIKSKKGASAALNIGDTADYGVVSVKNAGSEVFGINASGNATITGSSATKLVVNDGSNNILSVNTTTVGSPTVTLNSSTSGIATLTVGAAGTSVVDIKSKDGVAATLNVGKNGGNGVVYVDSKAGAVGTATLTIGHYTRADDYSAGTLTVDGNSSGNKLLLKTAGSSVFQVDHDGNVYAAGNIDANYTFASDRRVKDNIVPLSETAAMENVRKIEPVAFVYTDEWIKKGTGRQGLQYGFVAQDLAHVYPHVVRTMYKNHAGVGHDVFGVDQTALIPHLASALKGCLAEIDALRARLEKLEQIPAK